MPTFWPISSTQSVYKAVEASSRLYETEMVVIYLRPTDEAPGHGSVRTNFSTDLPAVRAQSRLELRCLQSCMLPCP